MSLIFKDYAKLNEKELMDILHLRNQKGIRENMINSDIISFEDHKNWVKSLHSQIDKKYFAIISEKEILGSLSFVTENEKTNWGVFFKEEVSPFISSASTFIFLEYLFSNKLKEISSCVKKTNLKALSFNKNFGFRIYEEDEDYYYLNLKNSFWEEYKKSRLLKPIKNYLDKIEYHFE